MLPGLEHIPEEAVLKDSWTAFLLQGKSEPRSKELAHMVRRASGRGAASSL